MSFCSFNACYVLKSRTFFHAAGHQRRPRIAACFSLLQSGNTTAPLNLCTTISCSISFQGRTIWLVAAEYDLTLIGHRIHLSRNPSQNLKFPSTLARFFFLHYAGAWGGSSPPPLQTHVQTQDLFTLCVCVCVWSPKYGSGTPTEAQRGQTSSTLKWGHLIVFSYFKQVLTHKKLFIQ